MSSTDPQTLLLANTHHAKVHAVEQVTSHPSRDSSDAVITSASPLTASSLSSSSVIVSNSFLSRPFIVIVMAVSAGGKSTIGALLTDVLKSKFSSAAAASSSSSSSLTASPSATVSPTSTSTSTEATTATAPVEVEFLDADAFHPEVNKQKMSQGIGLTDADRAEWLEKCSRELDACIAKGHSVVFACSALKKSYRRILFANSLREANEQCEQQTSAQVDSNTISIGCNINSNSRRPNTQQYLVFLRGSFALLSERITQRAGHFAGSSLLQSQFDTLQPPSAEECAAMNVKFHCVDLDAKKDVRVEADTIADWIIGERKLQ